MNKRGFTLIELLLVLMILAALSLFLLVIPLCRANIFVTEASALSAVQVINPDAAKIVNLERHLIGYSRVIVEDNQKQRLTFDIDANAMGNAKVIAAK